MNIFYLDQCPIKAAEYALDKHVVKMPLETAQILCSAFESAPYRRTHYKHPSSIWARSTKANYEWLIKHGIALCEEYKHRYGKEHKSRAVIEWCQERINELSFQKNEFTEPPQCMPDDAKATTSVEGYRNYYVKYKSYIFSWKNRQHPHWINNIMKI